MEDRMARPNHNVNASILAVFDWFTDAIMWSLRAQKERPIPALCGFLTAAPPRAGSVELEVLATVPRAVPPYQETRTEARDTNLLCDQNITMQRQLYLAILHSAV